VIKKKLVLKLERWVQLFNSVPKLSCRCSQAGKKHKVSDSVVVERVSSSQVPF
jgi:hypothetical protein